MNSDQILEKCGDFHRYQFLLLALFGVLNIFVAQHYFAQTLITFTPEHWCYHEKLENKSFDEIREIYSRFEDPSCTKLDTITPDAIIASGQKCDKWIYNYDYDYRSLVTELNWVCDSAFKSGFGQSMFFIGSVCGTLLYGLLSDRFGRLPILLASNLSAFIGDYSTILFTNSVVSFSISRFISGLAADTNTYLMYIIVLEYIRPSKRVMTLNIGIGVFYCIGLVVTPWLAVLVGNWKTYLMLTSTPLVLIISYYFLVSESAQWLVTQNNVEGAVKRLKRIAAVNRKSIPEGNFDEFRKFCDIQRKEEMKEKKANLFDLFKTPRLRKRTLILFYLTMVTTLCYNAVARNVEGTGISPFLMFSLSNIMVLPSGFILIFLQDIIGRKGMSFSSMSFCAATTIATGIITVIGKNDVILLVGLQMLARFGVAMSFEVVNQFATDLMPTCVRGQGVAIVHVSGYAASFLSVPILYLSTYMKALPSIILAALFLSGGFISLLLPETGNKPLPKTLSDGEELGRGEKFWYFPCFDKKPIDEEVVIEKARY